MRSELAWSGAYCYLPDGSGVEYLIRCTWYTPVPGTDRVMVEHSTFWMS